MRRLSLLLILLVLTACSVVTKAPTTRHTHPTPRCVTLVALALTSPNQVIAGAFSCQDEALQQDAIAHGVVDDHSYLEIAQVPPVVHIIQTCQPVGSIYSYIVEGFDKKGVKVRGTLLIQAAADGRVKAWDWSSEQHC